MFAFKFAAACVGAILGITVAVALAYPLAETNNVTLPKAAKLAALYSQPDAACPKIAWPYGCEWRPPKFQRNKHVLVQRRPPP